MIRTCLAVLAVLAVCSSFAFGQFRIGAHVGLNLSDVTEPDINVEKRVWLMRPHMEGGIAMDYAVSGHFLIAVQVNLIQKGVLVLGESLGDIEWGYTSFTENLVEIPVCVRWRVGDEPFRWFVECGPAVAYLKSAKMHSVIPGRQDQDFESTPGTVNISLVAGTGGEYHLTGSLFLTFSVHYARGMSREYAYNLWTGSRTQELQFDCGVLVSL